jgi:hypothetical protein
LEPAKHGHLGSLPTSWSVHSKPGGGGAQRLFLEFGVHGHLGSTPTKSSVHKNLGSGVVIGGRYVRDSGVVVTTGLKVVVVTIGFGVVKILGWVVMTGRVVVVMIGRVVVGSARHDGQDGHTSLAGHVCSTGLAHSFLSHLNETSQRPSRSPRKSIALLIGFGLLTNSFVEMSLATTFASTSDT